MICHNCDKLISFEDIYNAYIEAVKDYGEMQGILYDVYAGYDLDVDRLIDILYNASIEDRILLLYTASSSIYKPYIELYKLVIDYLIDGKLDPSYENLISSLGKTMHYIRMSSTVKMARIRVEDYEKVRDALIFEAVYIPSIGNSQYISIVAGGGIGYFSAVLGREKIYIKVQRVLAWASKTVKEEYIGRDWSGYILGWLDCWRRINRDIYSISFDNVVLLNSIYDLDWIDDVFRLTDMDSDVYMKSSMKFYRNMVFNVYRDHRLVNLIADLIMNPKKLLNFPESTR